MTDIFLPRSIAENGGDFCPKTVHSLTPLFRPTSPSSSPPCEHQVSAVTARLQPVCWTLLPSNQGVWESKAFVMPTDSGSRFPIGSQSLQLPDGGRRQNISPPRTRETGSGMSITKSGWPRLKEPMESVTTDHYHQKDLDIVMTHMCIDSTVRAAQQNRSPTDRRPWRR